MESLILRKGLGYGASSQQKEKGQESVKAVEIAAPIIAEEVLKKVAPKIATKAAKKIRSIL